MTKTYHNGPVSNE